MTRVFDEDGKVIPVTMVNLLSCKISQLKKIEKDGYSALQVGAIKDNDPKAKIVRKFEVRLDEISDYKLGQKIENEFAAGDVVEVTGTSKGKGFAGTIKRHGFKRGPEGHGGNNVREPGSIGAQQPQRVVLGRHMAGHMGSTTVTVKNLKVVDVKDQVVLVSGAIPGPNKSFVKIISK